MSMRATVRFSDIERLPMTMTLHASVGEFRVLRDTIRKATEEAGGANLGPVIEFVKEIGVLLARANETFAAEMETNGYWQKAGDGEQTYAREG